MPTYLRFEDTDIAFSINKDVKQARNSPSSDVDKPYNLVQWITNTSESFGSPDNYIQAHILYIKQWYKSKAGLGSLDKTDSTNTYIKFLKEVLLVYSSAEEARYLKNLDWNSVYDLDIAVPFFAKRLRDVILYVVEQRDKMKLQKMRNSFTGSVAGIKRYVYDQVVELILSEKYYLMYGTELPTISSIVNDLTVNVQEYFDGYQNYNNQEGGDSTAADRFNTTSFIESLPLSFDDAVIETLQSFPTALENETGDIITNEVGDNILPSLDVDANDVSRLTYEYFNNYNKQKNNLNLHNELAWQERYYGIDQYTLSASALSGFVYDKTIVATKPLENHLNITSPNIVTRRYSDEHVTTAEMVGGFFINTGLSHYYSLDTNYVVNIENITEDIVMQTPDPTVYSIETPYISYYEDIRWVKADKTNDALHGDIVGSEYKQKLYPYQSSQETNKFAKFGVSRVTDNFDFWTGPYDDVWSNSDIYQVLLPYDYRTQTNRRTEHLLLGSKRGVKWRTDVFGNEYVMLKETGGHRVSTSTTEEDVIRCDVVDGQLFWDTVTWIRPTYDTNIDGGYGFDTVPLSGYDDMLVGSYLKTYDCVDYQPYGAEENL